MTYYRRQRFESFKRALFAERLNAPAREYAMDIAQEAELDQPLQLPAPRDTESHRPH